MISLSVATGHSGDFVLDIQIMALQKCNCINAKHVCWIGSTACRETVAPSDPTVVFQIVVKWTFCCTLWSNSVPNGLVFTRVCSGRTNSWGYYDDHGLKLCILGIQLCYSG